MELFAGRASELSQRLLHVSVVNVDELHLFEGLEVALKRSPDLVLSTRGTVSIILREEAAPSRFERT